MFTVQAEGVGVLQQQERRELTEILVTVELVVTVNRLQFQVHQ